ncbi:hypothetical protein GWN42_13455 [candidate division KSB1 bacterium]|nr:hypothetical protein [candidate division KSB1 bacterium]
MSEDKAEIGKVEDRQYWLMVPDQQAPEDGPPQYISLCFSTIQNLLDWASKEYINLSDTFVVSAKPSRLKLISLEHR